MSAFKRCESDDEPPGGSFASSGEEVREGDESRTGVVVCIVRKGAMRSEPVRVRVRVSRDAMRDVMGRMGREIRGTIVRKRGRRWSIRLIVNVGGWQRSVYFYLFIFCLFFFFSCAVF